MHLASAIPGGPSALHSASEDGCFASVVPKRSSGRAPQQASNLLGRRKYSGFITLACTELELFVSEPQSQWPESPVTLLNLHRCWRRQLHVFGAPESPFASYSACMAGGRARDASAPRSQRVVPQANQGPRGQGLPRRLRALTRAVELAETSVAQYAVVFLCGLVLWERVRKGWWLAGSAALRFLWMGWCSRPGIRVSLLERASPSS